MFSIAVPPIIFAVRALSRPSLILYSGKIFFSTVKKTRKNPVCPKKHPANGDFRLYVESEKNDVSVFYHIFLAFGADKTLLFGGVI